MTTPAAAIAQRFEGGSRERTGMAMKVLQEHAVKCSLKIVTSSGSLRAGRGQNGIVMP